MFARLLYFPTLGYNIVMEKLNLIDWYNRIDDTVLLGALPFKSMTRKLAANEGVRGVVTMNEPYELAYFVATEEDWAAVDVEQLSLPTVDLVAAPSDEQLKRGVEFILKHRRRGTSVYVHCKAGRTRSTTVVVCYLMTLHKWNPEQAVDFIRSKRPHILLRKAQKDAIYKYYRQTQGIEEGTGENFNL